MIANTWFAFFGSNTIVVVSLEGEHLAIPNSKNLGLSKTDGNVNYEIRRRCDKSEVCRKKNDGNQEENSGHATMRCE